MVDRLLDRKPAWLAGNGPEAPVVVASECSLLRNLSDFPFPARCSEEERRAVEDRLMGALGSSKLLSSGKYYALSGSLSASQSNGKGGVENRFAVERLLAERWLVAFYEVRSTGLRSGVRFEAPEGVYVADDQSMSVMVNGADHLCVRVLASGMQVLDVWARLNLVDDTLANALGFAFDDRYGYFTADLGYVGTALKANVILHLPCLTMAGQIVQVAQMARERRQLLAGLKPAVAFRLRTPAKAASVQQGRPGQEKPPASRKSVPVKTEVTSEALYSDWYGRMHGAAAEAEGDLYALCNTATLGLSEEEILFHLRQTAAEIVAREQQARETLQQENGLRLDDRVARAMGLARTARLLEFREALALLSSIRLGVTAGMIKDYSVQQLNNLLLESQSFHVRMKTGEDTDELTLGAKRAELFRARFSRN
jgi:protein arginine kinase